MSGQTGDWFRSDPTSERLLAEERVVLGATELLAEAMERRGISQAELARRLKVSPSEISQRLSGKRNLSLRILAAMLDEMGFTLDARLKDTEARGNDVRVPMRTSGWPGMPVREPYVRNTNRAPLRMTVGGS